ncbi:TPA: hypothetical protein ACX6S7_002481 [Photobacterium damselae]
MAQYDIITISVTLVLATIISSLLVKKLSKYDISYLQAFFIVLSRFIAMFSYGYMIGLLIVNHSQIYITLIAMLLLTSIFIVIYNAVLKLISNRKINLIEFVILSIKECALLLIISIILSIAILAVHLFL